MPRVLEQAASRAPIPPPVDHVGMGYISPLQLHETNEGMEGMIEAFVELEKIKNCQVPFSIRQSCTCMTLFFVYTSPFAIATGFAQVITNPNPNPNPNSNPLPVTRFPLPFTLFPVPFTLNPNPNPNPNPDPNPNPHHLRPDIHRLQQHPRPHAALGLPLGHLLPLDQRDVAHARRSLRRRPARP